MATEGKPQVYALQSQAIIVQGPKALYPVITRIGAPAIQARISSTVSR